MEPDRRGDPLIDIPQNFGYNLHRIGYTHPPDTSDLYRIKNRRKMKFTLTGSLGHISKPLAETLVQQGHTVTIISSDPNKTEAITVAAPPPCAAAFA